MGRNIHHCHLLSHRLNLPLMKRIDRSEAFGLYVRCVGDIIDLLEQMYLTDGIISAQEIEDLDQGIDGLRFAMSEINRQLIRSDYQPFPGFQIAYRMGNC